MKTIFITLLTLLCVQCTRHPQLSTEQKLEDFDYLFQTLKENYPYFGIAKRQHGVDWISFEDDFREQISNTTNDPEFLRAIQSFIQLLQCSRLTILVDIGWMLDVYREDVERYEKWVEVLEKSIEQSIYWQPIWQPIWWEYLEENHGLSREEFVRQWQEQQEIRQQEQAQTENFSGLSLVENKIAYMRFGSFMYDNVANDSVYIASFLEQIQDYEYLIIDVQDNWGGSEHYWRSHIVGRMVDSPIYFPVHQVFRNGTLNRHFFPSLFERIPIATKENAIFPNLPCEILDGSFHILSGSVTIVPNNPIPFNGEIFLLVSERIFSTTESFAKFSKATGWATVVGVRTGGTGGGSEPVLIRLPNSGIIIRHPGGVGLNPDGSFNSETGTIPDIEIIAENSEQRLQKLIEYIKSR